LGYTYHKLSLPGLKGRNKRKRIAPSTTAAAQ
jgi:hypothetical protein